MDTTTIRIDKDTHLLLKEISEKTHKSMNNLINEMSAEYQKKLFWAKVDDYYSNLNNDKQRLREEQEENAIWDVTLSDGDE